MLAIEDKIRQIHWIVKDKYQGLKTVSDPAVQADIKRLDAGEPVAYIIGWVNFLNCHIDLSQKTLIPRPETEYWVEQLIGELSSSKSLKILDLCCGSGCIGIALLKNVPASEVEFRDIDPKAVAQTTRNIELNQIEKQRAHVQQADLFEGASGEYDLIVANPPYVAFSGEVGPETAFEPKHAIFAQNNGFELIDQILLKSKKYLKKDGKLVLEFGMGQEEKIEKKAKEAGFVLLDFRKDQFGVIRWAEFR
jgi:release factor-specific protein-(glutamine-N5) methyltransferase